MTQFEFVPNTANAGFRPAKVQFPMVTHAAVTENLVYAANKATATAANYGIATTLKAGPVGATEGTVWMVAQASATAAGQIVPCAIQGWVKIKMDGTGCSAGAMLTVAASGVFTVAVANDVIVAEAPEAIGAGAEGYVWFDGNGMTSTKGA